MADARRVAVIGVALLTIAACSGTSDPGVAVSSRDSGAPPTSPSGTTAPRQSTADLDNAALARSNEVLAMADADRNPVLFDAGMELELAVAHESGLEKALGGPDATKTALGEAWVPLLTQAQSIDPTALTLGGLRRRATPAVPEIGEGMFGAMMIVSLGASAGIVIEIPAGPPVSEDKGNGLVISASQNSTSLSYSGSHTDSTTGVTTTMETSSTVTPCPDANGSFDASGLMDVTVTKGSAGQHGTLDVTVVGQVDDDAHLVSSDLEYQMQWSKASGGAADLVDVTVKIPATGSADVTVNRSGGAATAALEQSATIGGMLYAMMMREALLKAAQEGWESGRCVRLDVTPSPAPKDMEPSSTAEIIAAPRSKIDGGPTGGNVTATLKDGGSNVDPSATPVPADANFTYTAHAEPNNHGTIGLEARSRRGVAKAELTFETRRPASFQFAGGAGDFQTTDQVCDIMKPFQLTGGGITASYSGGLTGTYSYTGPFDAIGDGTYTISLPNGPSQPGTMVGEGYGTVLGAYGANHSESFTLTPITDCNDG